MAVNRIAILTLRYPAGGAVGGAETLLKSLADYLAGAGKEVHFLTTCARNHFSWENSLPPGTEEIDGIKVHYFKVNEDRDILNFLRIQEHISAGDRVSLEDQQTWVDNNVNSRDLEDHLRAEGHTYDAIITGPYLFGLIMNAAKIHPERTWLVPCLHDECFAYLEVMKPLFEKVKGILFNAPPERDLAVKIFGIPEAKGHVVGMGISAFASDPAAFSRHYEMDKPYILYCGRREGLKGTPLMLAYMDAFRARTGRDVKVVLTGSGEIHPTAELKPHIIDLGYVSEEDMHEAMAGAVAFCHPSVNESFGIVLLESFIAGTPGLVHAQSAVLQYQCRAGNAGFWFRNYPEFEAMLLRLLDDKALRRQMGMNGRQYVEKEYAWDAIGRKLMTALDP